MYLGQADGEYLPAVRTGGVSTETGMSESRAGKGLGCHLLLPYFTPGGTEAQGDGAPHPYPSSESHVPFSLAGFITM